MGTILTTLGRQTGAEVARWPFFDALIVIPFAASRAIGFSGVPVFPTLSCSTLLMNTRQPIPFRLRKAKFKPRPTPPTRAREEAVGAAWNFVKAYDGPRGRSVTGYGLGGRA